MNRYLSLLLFIGLAFWSCEKKKQEKKPIPDSLKGMWKSAKKGDWYAYDYNDDGKTDYNDFEYWNDVLTEDERNVILYGDD